VVRRGRGRRGEGGRSPHWWRISSIRSRLKDGAESSADCGLELGRRRLHGAEEAGDDALLDGHIFIGPVL
jgi:hypothetical protein